MVSNTAPLWTGYGPTVEALRSMRLCSRLIVGARTGPVRASRAFGPRSQTAGRCWVSAQGLRHSLGKSHATVLDGRDPLMSSGRTHAPADTALHKRIGPTQQGSD